MKTGILTGILLLLFCISVSAQDADTVKYKILSASDFEKQYRKEDKAVLIDVREFFEYRKSRINDAVNIPSSGNLEHAFDTINKDAALYVYCTSGFRSKRVAAFLARQGFEKVYSLDGGISDWKKEGMPVVKKRIRKRD